MQKWEIAQNKFLEQYINEPWFVGAVLYGNYATGNTNKYSIIDIIITLLLNGIILHLITVNKGNKQ